MGKKLYRSRTDSVIAGVCGGLGKYLGIDSTIIRLLFIGLAGGDGAGTLIYFALWLLLPLEGQEAETSVSENIRAGADEIAERARKMGNQLRGALGDDSPRTALVAGGAFVLIGVLFLLRNLGLPALAWLKPGALWPLLLVIMGVVMLLRRIGKR